MKMLLKVFAVSFLLMFVGASFAQLDFNPSHWSLDVRTCVVFIPVGIALAAAFAKYATGGFDE